MMSFAGMVENMVPPMALGSGGASYRGGAGGSAGGGGGGGGGGGQAGSGRCSQSAVSPVEECRQEWMESLQQRSLASPEELRSLVLDYLVASGHLEAAAAYQREAQLPAPANQEPAEQAQLRVRSLDLVRSGNVAEAAELVSTAWPELLDSRPELCFRVRQQQLLELIRQERLAEALEFAQHQLSSLVVDRPELLSELEECMALLAFECPSDCVFGQWLGAGQRDRLASELNAAVMDTGGRDSRSRLDYLLRLLLWAQEALTAAKVTYPRLANVAEAKFQE